MSTVMDKFVLIQENKKQMNIFISGASRGIGLELVKTFLHDPSNRVFAISRNTLPLESLGSQIDAGQAGALFFRSFDIVGGNPDEELRAAVSKAFNGIDILINNAGAMVNKPFREMEDVDFDKVFDTNVKAVFRLTKTLLPFMKKGSHIVNIGSMGGYQGSIKFPGLSLYSASKGALAILSECLAVELAADDIRVNCLALGSANTEMLQEAFPGFEAPLSAAEMAAFISDFALRSHHYLNGKVIPVSLRTP